MGIISWINRKRREIDDNDSLFHAEKDKHRMILSKAEDAIEGCQDRATAIAASKEAISGDWHIFTEQMCGMDLFNLFSEF